MKANITENPLVKEDQMAWTPQHLQPDPGMRRQQGPNIVLNLIILSKTLQSALMKYKDTGIVLYILHF